VRETFVQNILHSSEGEAAVEVEAADRVKAAVKVSRLLLRCQGRRRGARPSSRCEGCCRGVEAAVEVSRPPSRCQGRCRSVEAAVKA
jgi:hypothetical protein